MLIGCDLLDEGEKELVYVSYQFKERCGTHHISFDLKEKTVEMYYTTTAGERRNKKSGSFSGTYPGDLSSSLGTFSFDGDKMTRTTNGISTEYKLSEKKRFQSSLLQNNKGNVKIDIGKHKKNDT